MVWINYTRLFWYDVTFVWCHRLLTSKACCVHWTFVATWLLSSRWAILKASLNFKHCSLSRIAWYGSQMCDHSSRHCTCYISRITAYQQYPKNIISSCSHLKYIKISMNMLQTLRRSSFVDDENTIVKISMFGNPWRCDSALAWLCDLDIGNFSHDGVFE